MTIFIKIHFLKFMKTKHVIIVDMIIRLYTLLVIAFSLTISNHADLLNVSLIFFVHSKKLTFSDFFVQIFR